MLDIAEHIVFMCLILLAAHSHVLRFLTFATNDPWKAVFISLPIFVIAITIMYLVSKVRYHNVIVASMLGALLFAALFGSHLESVVAIEFYKHF